MKTAPFLAAALALAASMTAYAGHYKIEVPFEARSNGEPAILQDYDNSIDIDSVTIADQVAVFEGEIDQPIIACVKVKGKSRLGFILEPGTITFDKDNIAVGTISNNRVRAIFDRLSVLTSEYRTAETNEDRDKASKKYTAAFEKEIEENAYNIVGYYLFINSDYIKAEAPELRELFRKYPLIARYVRSQRLLVNAEKLEATQPGNKFVDFEVSYNGKTKRLSDYVGKGKYVLVDFWASWCSPSIRNIREIKQIYNKYGRDKLEILGIAVWEDPEASLKAIERYEIPWQSIVNAQYIPTDLYRITAIPCNILFAPDGRILSRDKRGEELMADIDSEIAKIRITPSPSVHYQGAPFSK